MPSVNNNNTSLHWLMLVPRSLLRTAVLVILALRPSDPCSVPPEAGPTDSITWTCPLLVVGLGDGDIGRRSEKGGENGVLSPLIPASSPRQLHPCTFPHPALTPETHHHLCKWYRRLVTLS